MSEHESGVNFQNLICDLADMYPYDVSEVIVVELVANALDAKARSISVDFDPERRTLVVTDDGQGMTEAQFVEYHDFAAGLKARGTGIGFAGVGAKISFNIANRVVTETRSDDFRGGSNWYFKTRKRLIWEDFAPKELGRHGTRVEVQFRPDSRLAYSSSADIVDLLRRNYLPLLDKKFLNLYHRMGFYPESLRFYANGSVLPTGAIADQLALTDIREIYPEKAGKRVGYGIFGLARSEYPLGPDLSGVLLSTYGKVIKADHFNQFPGLLGSRIFGLVEVPDFVNFLTTSKTDFTRRGKYRDFERLYAPIREKFREWLNDLGIGATQSDSPNEALKLERELSRLVEEVPELSDFFGFRMKKQVLSPTRNGSLLSDMQSGLEITLPDGAGSSTDRDDDARVGVGDEAGESLVENPSGDTRAEPISRRGRRGPKISFSSVPERIDLAWVDGNNVVINSGHPAYLKAGANIRARMLHSVFAIATAIARFLSDGGEANDMSFIDRLMAAWGRK